MDIQTFFELGFTRNEAQLYLALVEDGKAPVQALARRLKLPRSTVYSVLEELEKRGLIRHEKIRSTTFFLVDDPRDFLRLIEKEERKIQRHRTLATDMVEELLQSFKQSGVQSPRMEFYEGKTKVDKFLNANLELWTQSVLSRDRSTWGYQDHSFVETFRTTIKRFWKVMHLDAGIAGRILSNRSDVERSLKGKIKGREVRVLGKELDFQSSVWVLGDFVILIMTRKEPIYAFQIHDMLLASNLRVLFRYLYEQASSDFT